MACPEGLVLCSDTEECVSDPKYCCGLEDLFCDVLDQCISDTSQCKLPNIAPSIPYDLVHVDSIVGYHAAPPSNQGKMIGLLLSNDTNTVGVDTQGEEVSIVVVGASNVSSQFGEWQYALCGASFEVCKACNNLSSWVTISDVSDQRGLYLPSTACIRFWRKSLALEGAVWMEARVWDGNSDGYISDVSTTVRFVEPVHDDIAPFTGTGSLSMFSFILATLLLPGIELPAIDASAQLFLPDLKEDVPIYDNLGSRLSSLVHNVTASTLSLHSVDNIPGFPDEAAFVEEDTYTDLLPPQAVSDYFTQVVEVNLTRDLRMKSVQLGNPTGLAISYPSTPLTAGEWQISLNGDPQLYVRLRPDLMESEYQVLLLNVSSLVRFSPMVGFSGEATLSVRAWDGVFPDSVSKLTVHTSIAYITDMEDLLPYHLGEVEHFTVRVLNTENSPIIIADTVQTAPIPYVLEYHYDSLFTVRVMNSTASLRSLGESHVGDIVQLALDVAPITVYRIYPASTQE